MIFFKGVIFQVPAISFLLVFGGVGLFVNHQNTITTGCLAVIKKKTTLFCSYIYSEKNMPLFKENMDDFLGYGNIHGLTQKSI